MEKVIYVRKHERTRPVSGGTTTVKEHQRRIEGVVNTPLERAENYPRRSAHAKATDKGKKAETVLPMSEKNLARWRAHPDKIDLKGVDTPTLIRRAKEIRQKVKAAKATCLECETALGKRKVALKLQEAKAPGKPRAALGWEPGQREAPAFHKLGRLEREGLLKLADAKGLDRRVVDWEALVDPTLTYSENKTLIAEFLGHGQKAASARAQLDEYEGQLQAHLAELQYRAENTEDEGMKKMIRAELSALAEAEA